MRNVVLARVDERLLHGQVATKWIQATAATTILLVDDDLVKDAFVCALFKGLKPVGTMLEILTIEQAVEWLSDKPVKGEKVILLCKYPQSFVRLNSFGIFFPKIIFGQAAKNDARHNNLIRDLHASDEEKKAIETLVSMGVTCEYQLAIDARPINLKDLV